ncbi:complement C1q tumor necrosis factor-related protein 2-like isoform X2 [Antedon mediterranea]|uniref:complement C1q tumor necrosis factor-related protein 2-like isoform X2 n=1 Tax=Antedon mediterranea TaxID=105859 RepID=UPI003AF82578
MYLRFNMMLTIVIQISIIYVIKSAAQTNSEACNSCCTAGVPGIPGNHGNPGAIGPQGMNGIQGMKGEQGLNGEQGMKGDNGSNGLDGIPGKLGPTGPQGLIGLPGANGVKGEKGEQASQQKSAFSVVFTSNPGRHDTSPMKYNTIISNVGNPYNKETGKFVCTIPGVYVFQVTSMKSTGGKILTAIKKNGNIQMTTRMDAAGYNSASTMVVLDLVSGDEVWTEPYNSGTNYYQSDSNRYCSFSGFLLYAA